MARDLDAQIDRLFGLPLEEFTQARNELARRLKKEGDGDSAATVQSLAKPTVAAWVVNQLARRESDSTSSLLRAAEAQERALAKGDSDALRKAMADQREALRALGSAARGILREAGRSATATTVERISSTLAAAAAGRETRTLLERGRLEGEVEPSGFTSLSGLTIGERKAPAAGAEDELAQRRRQKAEAAERARQLRASLGDLRRRARDADRSATKLEREAARARETADELQAEVERLEQELDEARSRS